MGADMAEVTSGTGIVIPQWSLLDGWLPLTVQGLAALAVLLVVVRRGRDWWTAWLPLAVLAGIATAFAVHAVAGAEGMLTDPAPAALWVWTAVTATAAVAVVAGWRARWWRRLTALAAVPLALMSTVLVLNQWVGYLPTVADAVADAAAAPLPDESGPDVSSTASGPVPAHGRLVPVTIPSTASGFDHRQELVYLPPAWFTGRDRTALPVVLMIGGEFSQPSDWPRTGDAVDTADRFAAAHHGLAPVLVFADASGSFSTDTECVNGTKGAAADHLTKDVRPFVADHFGLSTAAAHWGVAGFSTGGTCAIDLTVMHPELFSAFDDIEGDLAPNTGTVSQTVSRLFGGDAAAYAAFDPAAVMARHGTYTGTAGRFDESNGHTASGATVPAAQRAAAFTLATHARRAGIPVAVEQRTGGHNWQFAANAFGSALPWLVERLAGPVAEPRPGPTTNHGT
ncbi:alpha/beta hydrolase [Pseudonocardia phyllosphaerae]|uniref:alpha/beta hydrolase n=1 Tax=Pseudonocardia phyllosphaerae TaxID=3390502 RepID=UPI0039785F91